MENNAQAPQPTEPETTTTGTTETGPSADEKAILAELNINDTKTGQATNPMTGNVNARGEHAEIHTDATITQEIKEFTPPPPPAAAPGAVTPDQPAAPATPATPTALPPVNPAMGALTPDQQLQASTQLVDMIIEFWGWLKGGLGSFTQVSKDDIMKMHRKGLIDMNCPIPTARDANGQLEYATFGQVMDAYNTQSAEAFIVSVDFIKSVREPMIRECVRRGIGLTDLQLIMFMWTKESINTGILVFTMKKITNDIVENQKLAHSELLTQNGKPVATANAQPTAQTKAPDAQPAATAIAEIMDTAEVKGQ